MQLRTVYRFDRENKMYLGEDQVMVNADGTLQLPPDDTPVKPETPEGHWAKWSGASWEYIRKPTTAQEAIDMNLTCISNDPKPHSHEVKTLLEALAKEDEEHYKTEVSDDMVMSIVVIPPKTLEEVRTAKAEELKSYANRFSEKICPDMYVDSSVGYRINADDRSQTNLSGLISLGQPTIFKDYNNVFHENVTVEQMQTMLTECIQNGLNLYTQKFQLEAAIASATTIEQLNAIEFKFDMLSFQA